MAKNNNGEQHPNFPSGIWEGFYLYHSGPSAHRHPMSFYLNFKDGVITGSGTDDVGPFTWDGTYDVSTMAVTMIKSYRTHQVSYAGMADTNGIYGTWELPGIRGGFHIWPKKNEEEGKQKVVKKKKKQKKLSAV